jgi:hypothetical protein
MLDEQAKVAYRQRLSELREELEEARSWEGSTAPRRRKRRSTH